MKDGPRGQLSFALILIACAIMAGVFLWQGHAGLNLDDEGFLWYGAQRVLAGEVPVRDFMSYDPGRYYWSAALIGAMGDDGLTSLRIAAGVFGAVGLSLALLLLQKRRRIDPLLLALAAIALTAWMYPRHKLFDVTLSIGLISVTALIIRNPRRTNFFIAGVVLGAVAVFGRNHGVYGVFGLMGGIAYLACLRVETIGSLLRNSMVLAGGVFVGYLPVISMIVFVPGFGRAFWAEIAFVVELGSTNLPLPIPWPWLAPFDTEPPLIVARELMTGTLFIAVATLAVCGPIWALRRAMQRRPADPTLVSCAFLAVPYAHFAFSRADITHLAQGIFPLLIGCFALSWNRHALIRWPLGIATAAVSLSVTLPLQPGWICQVSDEGCLETRVAGDVLNATPNDASHLEILEILAERYSAGGRSFVVTPFWPGAYAALRRKSPIYEIYALFPRNEPFQELEIEKIKKADPGFVFVIDVAVDGRESLRFRNTHSLIDRFFRENFQRLSDADLERLPVNARSPLFQIYKPKVP